MLIEVQTNEQLKSGGNGHSPGPVVPSLEQVSGGLVVGWIAMAQIIVTKSVRKASRGTWRLIRTAARWRKRA